MNNKKDAFKEVRNLDRTSPNITRNTEDLNKETNKLIHGRVGSGKAHMLKSIVSTYGKAGEKIFLFSQEEDLELCKQLNIKKYSQEYRLENCYREYFDTNVEPYFLHQTLISLINSIQGNINDIDKPLLIAFDELASIDLSYKMQNNKSIFLNLLELNIQNPKISIVATLINIKELSEIYKKEYEDIISLCKIISTNQLEMFSGEIRLRMPRSLHQKLVEGADIEGTSLNQYIIYLLSQQVI